VTIAIRNEALPPGQSRKTTRSALARETTAIGRQLGLPRTARDLRQDAGEQPHDLLGRGRPALPNDQRDVVAAVDVAGLSYAEAAEALCVPAGMGMSRLHRGRSRVAATVGA
jgi:predicted RNA polymerase sigma factor